MSSGALHISRRLWWITIGVTPPESLSETYTAACLFTPRVLVCFCLLTLGPSSIGPRGRDVLCTVDFAAPALASSSTASLYTSLLCPNTCVIDTDAILLRKDGYMSSHISWCLTGCLRFATQLQRLHSCRLPKMSTHHLESLYRHNSWVLRTARKPALTADTSAPLFVCSPSAGSLMLPYSPWGKKTPNPARPWISDPSTRACILVESNRCSGMDSAPNNSTRKSCPRIRLHSSSHVLMCVGASDHWSSACTCVRAACRLLVLVVWRGHMGACRRPLPVLRRALALL